MREQLNNNPAVQLAVVCLLVLAGGYFFLSMSGGGSEGGGESAAGTSATAPTETTLGASGAGVGGEEISAAPVEAVVPPSVEPPARLVEAYNSGRTVVLLFVHDGGIDDHLVREITQGLASRSEVDLSVVPAKDIARYAAVTGGVGVERLPALVVLTPKGLAAGEPTASVHYGFQHPEAIVQAVVDAEYKGPTREYHP